MVALRNQAAVSGAPFIGKWSVLIDLVEDGIFLQNTLTKIARELTRKIQRYHLTPKEVTGALNIIPPFIENSIFWTLSAAPAEGTVAPVDYQAFLMVIRGGQEFLAGPINDGQPGVIQVKDVVPTRTLCA